MEEKILYILGAGASAEALPLARTNYGSDGLARHLEDYIPISQGLQFALKKIGNYINLHYSEEIKAMFVDVIAECKQLAHDSEDFSDIDTYAKYLFVKGKSKELKSLKDTISRFFLIRQFILKQVDRRYKSWLVSIMESNTFPNNIKIFNWNYDSQMQITASSICNLENAIFSTNRVLQSHIGMKEYIESDTSDWDSQSLIHINGVAGLIHQENYRMYDLPHYKNEVDVDYIQSIINNQYIMKFRFAWEDKNYTHVKEICNSNFMKDITILVVVGYSFPFFNRGVDNIVMQTLIKGETLRKIYYQDPFLDGSALISKFILPERIKIVHISDTDNFYIPFEY